jgi:hypothetical protein
VRVALGLLPGGQEGRRQVAHAAHRDLAPGVVRSHDELVHVRVGAGRALQAVGGRSGGGGAVQNRHELGRQDEAEALALADFVGHRRAAGVFLSRHEVRQVTNVRFEVGGGVDQIAARHRVGAVHRAGLEDRGNQLAVVGLQALGHLADHRQRDGAVDRGTAGAGAAVEHVGARLQLAEDDHLVDQRDALADLLLHGSGDVVLVQPGRLVGPAVEAGVLLHHHGHVLRRDRVGGRGDAFRGLVRLGDGVAAINQRGGAEKRVGRRCRGTVGQPAASHVGVAVVLGEGHLPAGARQAFQRHGVLQDLAAKLVEAARGQAKILHRHGDDSFNGWGLSITGRLFVEASQEFVCCVWAGVAA